MVITRHNIFKASHAKDYLVKLPKKRTNFWLNAFVQGYFKGEYPINNGEAHQDEMMCPVQ